MNIRGEEQDQGKESETFCTLVTSIFVNALVSILTRGFLPVEVYKPPLDWSAVNQRKVSAENSKRGVYRK